MHREETSELAVQISGSARGSKRYLSVYRCALRKIEEDLTPSQCQEYKEMAVTWTEKNPPAEVQKQCMHGNGSNILELTDFFALGG